MLYSESTSISNAPAIPLGANVSFLTPRFTKKARTMMTMSINSMATIVLVILKSPITGSVNKGTGNCFRSNLDVGLHWFDEVNANYT